MTGRFAGGDCDRRRTNMLSDEDMVMYLLCDCAHGWLVNSRLIFSKTLTLGSR